MHPSEEDFVNYSVALQAGYAAARAGHRLSADPCRHGTSSNLAPGDIPYHGDYRGTLWNAQGLFHSKSRKQAKKWRLVFKLLQSRDFLFLSETHSTPGKIRAVDERISQFGFRAFWSHATSHRAGVAILIGHDFLKKFSSGPPQWSELVPGELACLHLRGQEGNLDLYSAYFPTGMQADEEATLFNKRALCRSRLHGHLSPGDLCLSIVGGDFNYVIADRDRINLRSLQHSGNSDARDQNEWIGLFNGAKELQELHQDMATHATSQVRSRLDRVYTSQHLANQLDSRLGCTPLDWCPDLSHHRPLAFFRNRGRTNREAEHSFNVISEDIIRRVEWPIRVAQRYAELLRSGPTCRAEEDPSGNSEDYRFNRQHSGNNDHNSPPQDDSDSPLRRLFMVKEAIRSVSTEMSDEKNSRDSINISTEADDQLGWTLKCIRAFEGGRTWAVNRCCTAYPHLNSIIQVNHRGLRSAALAKLKNHALELARRAALDELRHIQADEGIEDEGVQKARRQKVQARLHKLRPGNCCSVAALQDSDGNIITDADEIAVSLKNYWSRVFADKVSDRVILDGWFSEEFPNGPPWRDDASEDWEVRRNSVRRAISKSSRSAPGPDGIPYLAWRRLGTMAEDILYEVASCLGNGSIHDFHCDFDTMAFGIGHSFNLGNMCFLPKKIAGTDPLLGDYYTASDLRPLMIVNTDNRLVANAMRLQWEPIFDKWISSAQQGFLPGRSMASNVIEVDSAAQRYAISHPRAGILLLDFKAAFPSICHDYLHSTLTALGVPLKVRTAIRNLYDRHRCRVSFGGSSFEGFAVGAGIRQGCPISPLLFAVVVDIVLRRLRRLIPGSVVKAFADDIAIVVEDVGSALPILEHIFQDLERMAGLFLNRPKCVLIPLWASTCEQVSRELAAGYSSWANISVSYSGKYLGVQIGPESTSTFWDQAVAKYLDRAKQWGSMGLGLFFAATAYQTYILPTLSFLAQFRKPGGEVYKAEGKALAYMVPGPGHWCEKEDFYQLGKHLGQQKSFPSVGDMGLAARTRLMVFENLTQGGLGISVKFRNLQDTLRNMDSMGRLDLWHSWFFEGILAHIHSCRAELGLWDLNVSTLLDSAATPRSEEESPVSLEKRRKKNFQKTVRTALLAKHSYSPTERMRHKLDRWNLAGFPGETASKCIQSLSLLKKWVPPRVCSAVLRTMWNGWCTQRRFQQSGHCVFQCGCFWSEEDSIEHYSKCEVVVGFARRRLNLRPTVWNQGYLTTLGLSNGFCTPEELTIRALWVYAVYKAHNLLRYRRLQPGEDAVELLAQYSKEGAFGHNRAMHCLDNAFRSNRDGRQQSHYSEPLEVEDEDFDIFD